MPSVPAPLVVGVQQEPGQLVDGAAGPGDMAGDRRRDAVPVPGRALPVPPHDHGVAVGAKPAVAARRIAAGEIPEQDELGRSRTEAVKTQSAERVRGLSLWFCPMTVVWHGGVVSQSQGRHPGPLKPRVTRNRPPIGASDASRIAVLKAFVCLAPLWRQASPSQLDQDRRESHRGRCF